MENTQTAGLVCNAVSVTFRNLIVENAAVKAVNDGSGNAYAGVFVGRSYGTIVFANCQAVNSTVEGVNKVGGMLGFVAENHIEATGCKVVGCTISNINVPEESGQIGGFAGYLGNLYNSTCSFANCSVENSVINAYMNREDRTISKFIGCFQGDQATDIVSIDNCSVKNVTLKGMNEMAQSFVSTYGDLLGGQRYGKGTVKITNSNTGYLYLDERPTGNSGFDGKRRYDFRQANDQTGWRYRFGKQGVDADRKVGQDFSGHLRRLRSYDQQPEDRKIRECGRFERRYRPVRIYLERRNPELYAPQRIRKGRSGCRCDRRYSPHLRNIPISR